MSHHLPSTCMQAHTHTHTYPHMYIYTLTLTHTHTLTHSTYTHSTYTYTQHIHLHTAHTLTHSTYTYTQHIHLHKAHTHVHVHLHTMSWGRGGTKSPYMLQMPLDKTVESMNCTKAITKDLGCGRVAIVMVVCPEQLWKGSTPRRVSMASPTPVSVERERGHVMEQWNLCHHIMHYM